MRPAGTPERVKAWHAAHPERVRAIKKAWRCAHPEKQEAARKAWRAANRERERATDRARYAANPTKESLRSREWQAANPEVTAARNASRKARKLQATPAWANEFFIAEAYHLAKLRTKLTGIEHHVDHRVPLKSKIVCGLHNEFNLRVIPAVENLSKGNRVWEDMP